MSSMTREDVTRIVWEARDRGVCPDLRGADLAHANLYGADLYGADLRGANLRGANLRGADLYGAHLAEANLYGADLAHAHLAYARWDGFVIDGLHPHRILLTPTLDGWRLTIGCWWGTPDDLRTLIAQDVGWPEARGDEIARRRPLLNAALTTCDAHIAGRPHIINDLKERWQA